jgi:hypothetical protein
MREKPKKGRKPEDDSGLLCLTRREINDLNSALGAAIELYQMTIGSELPPKGCPYTAEDQVNFMEWDENLRVFGELRKKLQKVEESW